MNSGPPLHYEEPTNKAALVLSAAVHAALVAALFFGVQWKNEQPGGTPVDVYYGNPAASLPPPRPTPEPEPTPVPEQKPLPRPEPKVAEPPKIDPQIAIKDKERREKEEKAKLEKERLEKEKAEKLKKQKLEEEQKQKEEIRKEEEEKKKREQKEKDARRAAELAKEADRDLKHSQQQRSSETVRGLHSEIDAELKGLRGSPNGSPTGRSSGTQGSAGDADSRGKNAYIEKIRDKIRGHAVLPPGVQGNPEAVFEVIQLPSGELISVKLIKSTGNKQLDEAIERAIRKSDPLPQPQKAEWFDRSLKLKYKPFVE